MKALLLSVCSNEKQNSRFFPFFFFFFFTQNEYEEKGRIFSFVQAESKVRAGNSHGSWRVCGHRRITTWGAPG